VTSTHDVYKYIDPLEIHQGLTVFYSFPGSSRRMYSSPWKTVSLLATLAYADFYVSLNGSDAAAGTAHAPFKSFERAQEAVRGVVDAMDEDVKVFVAPGTYYLDEPLFFTDLDSGNNGHKVVWEAQDMDKGVDISGGYAIFFSLSRDERPKTHDLTPASQSPTGLWPSLVKESTRLQRPVDSRPAISLPTKSTLNALITLSTAHGLPTIPKATG